MRKLLFATGAMAVASVAMPVHAATDAECRDMWQKADTDKDGKLSDAEAQRYLAMMRIRERTLPANGVVDQAAFTDACRADVFVPHKADAGAPLKGANSFTEGQAKDRAVAQGFGGVSDLKKDDNGIWRGRGTMNGKQVEIAVDYKGNVVSTSQ
jgi:hypothetical protein